jgi:hypothetical protein
MRVSGQLGLSNMHSYTLIRLLIGLHLIYGFLMPSSFFSSFASAISVSPPVCNT